MEINSSSSLNNQYSYMNQGSESIKRTEEGENVVDMAQKQNSDKNYSGKDELKEAIEKSCKGLNMDNTTLEISIHEKTKQIMAKIVDKETKEVIREIPSEKIVDMIQAMIERAGLFVDKKA
ncbi:flagellar protein FlaG [Crassaminicella profunda]|uniref:flagellar protein FlaG n=1 Tax=Crassaminicella profunda TaxID=1286698 RepID=UPI001CA6C018|nr:flagellar protein FlaG [Crassaminicella profunda]QZY54292.1 flagellar protein FlaG [Crassaminicella profunda]